MYPREVAIRLPSAKNADILIVEDSLPFGTYEASEDLYATRVGELLGKRVVNLGVGSTLPPAYNRMIEVGARYHPRVMVYAVFANDFLTEDGFEPRRLALKNTFRSLDRDREWFFNGYDTNREGTKRGSHVHEPLSELPTFEELPATSDHVGCPALVAGRTFLPVPGAQLLGSAVGLGKRVRPTSDVDQS